jgi:hypothetical protein
MCINFFIWLCIKLEAAFILFRLGLQLLWLMLLLLIIIEIDGFRFLKRLLLRLINNTFVLFNLKLTNIIIFIKVFHLYGQWLERLLLWLRTLILFRELYWSGSFLSIVVTVISFIES